MSPEEEKWLELTMDGLNGTEAVRQVWPDLAPGSDSVKASRLKSKLGEERDKRLRERMSHDSVMAYRVIKDLAETAKQPAVKLKAAKDMLDRGGFKPADKWEDVTERATDEEYREMIMAGLPELFAVMGIEAIMAVCMETYGPELISARLEAMMLESQDPEPRVAH